MGAPAYGAIERHEGNGDQAGSNPCFFMGSQRCESGRPLPRRWPPMVPESPQRPAWLNWLFLLAFLWSSYQLAGLWFQRLHS
jgi:hypothetical protein